MKRISIAYVCVRDKFSDHGHFKSVPTVVHGRVKKGVPALEYTGARIVCLVQCNFVFVHAGNGKHTRR